MTGDGAAGSKPDLPAIKARLDRVPPVPYAKGGEDGDYWVEDCAGKHVAECDDRDMAILFAHAPADLAALVAEVERLTVENDGVLALAWRLKDVG